MYLNTNVNNVPTYLQKSKFYEALVETCDENENDNGDFNIDESYYKQDTVVKDLNDLTHLLETLRFWVINYDDYPFTKIFDFVLKNIDKNYENLIASFPELEIMNEIQEMVLAKRSYDNRKFIKQFENFQQQIAQNAMVKGYIKLLKYICETNKDNINFNDKKYICKVNSKNLQCVIYAHEIGFKLKDDNCYEAAIARNVGYLKYLHKNGYSMGKNIANIIVKYGSIECLEYAHSNNCHWDEKTCMIAAANGNLKCLQYLHKNGCPWDKTTPEGAAMNGSLECLKYALQNGCRMDKVAQKLAFENNEYNCFKYIKKICAKYY